MYSNLNLLIFTTINIKNYKLLQFSHKMKKIYKKTLFLMCLRKNININIFIAFANYFKKKCKGKK